MSNQTSKVSLPSNEELPAIPEKLYFTIGEVGRLCKLRPHVLRYWEQEFPQLSPSKRRGNRRYYQRKDVLLVREIRDLLYNQGYTIEGARQQLGGVQAQSGQAANQQVQDSLRRAVTSLEGVLETLEARD